MNRIDDYNAKIETTTPAATRLGVGQPLRDDLAAILKIGGEVSSALKEILEKEP
jgi:hypothetical protein